MRICMIGTGYVGLVSGACLAEQGNEVWCVDVDDAKVQQLQSGHIPIYESGLEEIIKRNTIQGRLHFTTDLKEGLEKSLFVFIAVGTPTLEDGSAELKFVYEAARNIGSFMDTYKIIVMKSTVPVGTTIAVQKTIVDALAERGRSDIEFDVAFCPEFLKEGSAVEDFMKPDRIIIGAENIRTTELLKELYSPFTMREPRILSMSIASAELSKYAANAMLATRISFMNEMACLCELVGADIEEIRQGIGSDSRIGSSFLYAGLGYGGSCFPKDLKALIHSAKAQEQELLILRAVENVNRQQRELFLNKIKDYYGDDLQGRRFAVWGLSFKPRTDDMREAPSVDIIKGLCAAGATVKAFDPVAMDNARPLFPKDSAVSFANDEYDTLQDADALLLLTEWPVFRKPDFERMKAILKQPVIFDGRNQYNPDSLKKKGFMVYGIGRGNHGNM